MGTPSRSTSNHIKTLVFDQDGTTASRNLVRQFQGSTYFQITGFVTDYHVHQSAPSARVRS